LKKTIFILILLPLLLSANTAFLFLFNNNMMLEKDTSFYFIDNIELPMKYFENVTLAFFFDLEENKKIFFGPTDHNHLKQTFLFNIKENELQKSETICFSDYFSLDREHIKNLSEISSIAYAFSLKELSAVISGYRNETDTLFSLNKTFISFGNLLMYRKAKEEHQFKRAMNFSQKIYESFPQDESALKIYIYSLMDIADFYTADSQLNKFYKKSDKKEDYYSLKANLFAIWGKFDEAVGFIEKGRFLFPESEILLQDAINIYSVIDTMKMLELIEYYQIK